ncbi:unnamed protein product [Taenia asiatica]|uniref:Mediator of RNA polymerase II transcription subunit 6 n=1 Tax=Taenia asiatica TaxID=60517 RepID=A0A0R3WFS8_TAEAS|nr:unnamed protein product [Taenia asiatica]
MPQVISGKVVAVGRFKMDLVCNDVMKIHLVICALTYLINVPFTFDQTMRDVIRQLNHLPLGHAFYFVVLDFDASVVGESTRSQMEYGKALDTLSERQVNVLEAVGYDINEKLSLDLKRTGVYFVDELFSLPDAEHLASRDGIPTQIPLLQRPVRWGITELPSGSKAFFTEEMLRERLLEEQQEQKQLLLEQTQQEQIQPSHCLWNALQQQVLGMKSSLEQSMPLFPSPREQRSRSVYMRWGCRQLRCLQVPRVQTNLHPPQSSQEPHQVNGKDKMELKTQSTRHTK